MAGNVLKFPSVREKDFIREEILATLEENENIDVGIILLQSGEDISIFISKYSVQLIGALEVLKTKITTEILIEEDDDE